MAAAMIDWESSSSHLLANPRMQVEEKLQAEALIDLFPGHIWLSSSGSVRPKWVALSKKAFLVSAAAVNDRLQSNGDDVWALTLPAFHVGGLSIYARAHLSSASVVKAPEKWGAEIFCAWAEEVKPTLASLVPTQMYDIVKAGCKAPPSLRALFVGGGSLDLALYKAAKELRWPLLLTYGMTECASQAATATIDDPALRLLDHIEARVDEAKVLWIKSEALCSACAYIEDSGLSVYDPKQEGWLCTEDVARLDGRLLTCFGRGKNVFKVSGENVHVDQLNMLLKRLCLQLQLPGDAAVVARDHPRLGKALHLLYDTEDVEKLVEAFNAEVMPFERIQNTEKVSCIPRSPLGKLQIR